MRSLKYIVVLCGAVALLSACRSSRHAQREDGPSMELLPSASDGQSASSGTADNPPATSKKKKDKTSRSESKEQPSVRRFSGIEAMTAKLNLTLEAGQKRVSVGGSYRLKRNDVIQINLTYTMLLTINVGTLELTPDYILLVDRVNKRFCKVAYSDVPAMAQAGVDFNYLQSIFWGEAEQSPTRVLEWVYNKWIDLGQGQFPSELRFTLKPSSSASYQAFFALSDIRESSDWNTRTEVSSKYTEVQLETVLKALMNIPI